MVQPQEKGIKLTRDQKHHVFYNSEGFHNHTAHHLLSLYGLGAPADVIEQRYKENASYQRSQGQLDERVLEDLSNPENFKKYLNKEKYYKDFLHSGRMSSKRRDGRMS